MTARRLLVVDRYDAPALVALHHQVTAAAPWDVLFVGRGHEWYRWRHTTEPLPEGLRLVDPAPLAAQANEAVGTFVVETIGRLPERELGGVTLADDLDTEDGSLWWRLDLSEKGPYRTPLVARLFRLALTRLVIEHEGYREITAAVTDPDLARVFERSMPGTPGLTVVPPALPSSVWRSRLTWTHYWTHACSALVQALAIRWMAALGGWRGTRAGTGGLVAFTFFPAWWANAFGPRESDRFFSSLEASGLSGYLAWLGQPRALWRSRRDVRDVCRRRGFVVLQRFIRLRDAGALLSVRAFLRARRAVNRVTRWLQLGFAGFDVSGLVADEFRRAIVGGEPFQDLLIARAVRRCAAALHPRAALFRLEFQPTETAMLRGLQGACPGIGFLHFPFGRNYLSMRFSREEMARHLAARHPARDRPLPSGVMACGRAGIDHFAESGFPRARMSECGPQRYGRLMDYRRGLPSRRDVRARLGLPDGTPIYAVTLAIREEDTEALFGALGLAAPALGEFIGLVRTHPNRPRGDDALRSALAALGPGRAMLMDPARDLYDYLLAADAIIAIGSMIAFEAMALGTMPVVFDNPGSFAALSLAEFEDGLFVASDSRSLASALGEIRADGPLARAKRREWPSVLARVMGDLDTPLPEQMTSALLRLGVPHAATPHIGVQ
jgi:hypothetical protein